MLQEQIAKQKAKEKQVQALEGNLAMKFLLRGGGLDSFIHGKKDKDQQKDAKNLTSVKKQASKEEEKKGSF